MWIIVRMRSIRRLLIIFVLTGVHMEEPPDTCFVNRHVPGTNCRFTMTCMQDLWNRWPPVPGHFLLKCKPVLIYRNREYMLLPLTNHNVLTGGGILHFYCLFPFVTPVPVFPVVSDWSDRWWGVLQSVEPVYMCAYVWRDASHPLSATYFYNVKHKGSHWKNLLDSWQKRFSFCESLDSLFSME